jgi:hypothetical protein
LKADWHLATALFAMAVGLFLWGFVIGRVAGYEQGEKACGVTAPPPHR